MGGPVNSQHLGKALRLLRGPQNVTQTTVSDWAVLTKAMLSCYETLTPRCRELEETPNPRKASFAIKLLTALASST